jgi:outer membrane protein TolC
MTVPTPNAAPGGLSPTVGPVRPDRTRRKRLLPACLAALSLLSVLLVRGQDDTPPVLTEEAFMGIVRNYHPVARQANLVVDRATAEWVAAKAGFDPYLGVVSERKTFDGKNYFNYFSPTLKIPTWYGVEVSAGLEEHLGEFINPERTKGRASYLSVSVPVARDLVIDRRRAVLRQAQLYRGQSRAERALMVNDLMYEALTDYWKWAQAHVIHGLLAEVVSVNEARLRFIRLSHAQGDRPALDTTEALAQLQAFQLSRDQAWLDLRKAALDLSNHLWQANDSPWYLPPQVRPDTSWIGTELRQASLPVLEDLLSVALASHPKLQGFDFKLQALEVERRLKFQELLPQVDLKYSVLGRGYASLGAEALPFFRNNYKFGIDASMPLFLFKGRGQYRAARIKIADTDLERMRTRLAISNKVKYHFTELAVQREQSVRAGEYVESNARLFRGEEMRFRVGEGTLFLLNARENKLLEARQKQAETRAKYYLSRISLRWAAGQLQ